jgi:beta-glucosidase
MKSIAISILFILIHTVVAFGQKSTETEIDAKVDSVLNLMTLEEKIGQMTLFTSDLATTGPTIRDNYKKLIKAGKVGALFNAYGVDYTTELQDMATKQTRLGIPLLFGYDVIHGFRTIFPIPLGESASWNIDLIEESARVAAREGASSGLHWTFAPMVDIARDARWGRIAEGAGEDAYLGSKIAAARVRGFQGDDLSDLQTVLATAKHFAAYGAAEGGRDYNTVNMSDRRLREVYLPPFEATIEEDVATFMTAFNELNGIPATGDRYLFNQILRDEWNFDGFVVTDYTSIPEMIAHGVPANEAEAAELAIKANVDMDMQSSVYLNELPALVEKGEVSEAEIDQAAGRILKMKFKLGLFEDPYRYSDKKREEAEILSEENRAMAREMARESIVLLKNENNLLPLKNDIQNISVIGPLADNQKDLLGSWSAAGQWEDNVTLLSGIKNAVGDSMNIQYAKGTSISGEDSTDFSEAVQLAANSEIAIVALGESRNMSGEAASRATLDLPGRQQELLEAIHATGTPVVLVLMSGRPLAITWADENVTAILETWFLGTEAGHAIADVLFGDYSPSGKLTVTFPRVVGQVPYYYNHKNTGRPPTEQKYTSKYIDVENSPLYPFGYGLSYTTFKYSNLSLGSDKISKMDSVQVSVTVSNTGERAGQEVVQLYIRDLFASVSRPVKELRGFKKINLEPGDSQKVTFTLTPEDLSFYNQEMKKVVEPGEFEIMVGSSSSDQDLKKSTLTVQN